jgi:hypothetical protein
MAARLSQPREFERELRIATEGLSPDEIRKELAEAAHEALEEVIEDGEASENYRRFVNGREGVPEEAVQPPGPIVYEFDYQAEIADYALNWARAASPVQSGRFRDAWFVMVEGAQVDPDEVPTGAEITITNDRPYARKIEIGHQTFSVPHHITQRLAAAIRGQYGNIVAVRDTFVDLQGAYVLKGTRRSPQKVDSKGRAHKGTVHKAGELMRYPACVVEPL